MKRVLLYGAGRQIKKLADILPGLLNYAEVFADRDAGKTEYLGKKVIRPGDLNLPEYADYPIVITVKNREAAIREELIRDCRIAGNRFYEFPDWIADALECPAILLRPKSARLDICTACQLDCAGCYMRRDPGQTIGTGMVSREQFQAFLEENPFLESLEISNSGEPFLHPALPEMLRLAAEKNIDITILNGTNFNAVSGETLEALVRYRVKGITISLDGASQEVYRRYRRKGDIEKVFANIRRLNEIKKSMNSPYPGMIWQFIVMKENEAEAEKAAELARSLGMTMMYKRDSRGPFMPEDPEKLARVTGMTGFGEEGYREAEQQYISTFCRQILYSPQINWDGRLLGCCTVYRTDWGVNVFREGFLSCVNRDDYRKAAASLVRGTADGIMGPCRECSVPAGMARTGSRMEL